MRSVAEIVPPAQINARSPNSAQAAPIMATVSAEIRLHAAKAEANRRCSRGDPRRDLFIGLRWQLHRQRANEGPLAIPFRPFGCQPGKAKFFVGLDFQRSAFGDPSWRRGLLPSVGLVHDAAPPRLSSSHRAKSATRTLSLRRGPMATAAYGTSCPLARIGK